MEDKLIATVLDQGKQKRGRLGQPGHRHRGHKGAASAGEIHGQHRAQHETHLPSLAQPERRQRYQRDRGQAQGIPRGHARWKRTWGNECQGSGQHQPKQTKTSQPAQ